MKTVFYHDYRDELEALNEEVRRISDNGSKCWSSLGSIVNMGNEIFGDTTINVGINWCACGDVSLDRAEMFAKEMKQVLQLARNFKYNGYRIVYTKSND